jgi:iron complex outermembrane receptor protein
MTYRLTDTIARIARGAALLCLVALGAVPAMAQDMALTGRVVDASGAVVPGVTVTASSGAQRRSVVTDREGRFTFATLAPGAYDVQAELFGFSPAIVRGITVPSSAELPRLELRLEAAGVSESVTITGTRGATPIAALPTSVTVLGRESLDEQTALSRNLHTILGKTLPGFGLSRESESNFGQNLRGRGMLVLLDGVPQNFELRQGALDELSRIDVSRIERIEVVRGASAAYGSEAAGGIINIITKSGTRAVPSLNTEIGTSFSANHAGDSNSLRLFQDVGGISGRTSYFAAGGVDTTGSAFDADGNRIPEIFPVGLAQTTAVDLGGRLSRTIAPQQQLGASAHWYFARKDQAFGSVDGIPHQQTARAMELPVGIGSPTDLGFSAERPYKRQGTYTVSYDHAAVAGSQVSAQLLHLHYNRMNDYFAFGGGQLNPQFRKTGARVDVQTPLPRAGGASLTWGTDYVFYRHAEPTNTGFTWTPPLDQRSLAGFVQAGLPIGRVTLRGGLRYEDFGVDIDDFQQNPAFGARTVRGGTLDYDATTFNVGAVVSAADAVQLFAGFSQGFSITQVGRLLVNTPLSSVGEARPEPSTVDNYEVGVRAGVDRLQMTAAGYYATSELGTSLVSRGIGPPEVIRAPEHTVGFEATLDVQPATPWRAGGTLSWQDGEQDPDFNGSYTPMPGFRISPLKISGYVEHDTLPRWRNRLQVTHSGSRDEFPGSTAFGEGRVEDVTLVDFVTAIRFMRGTLHLGIENLANATYVPPINQSFNDGFNYIAGRGRTVSINFAVPWTP